MGVRNPRRWLDGMSALVEFGQFISGRSSPTRPDALSEHYLNR